MGESGKTFRSAQQSSWPVGQESQQPSVCSQGSSKQTRNGTAAAGSSTPRQVASMMASTLRILQDHYSHYIDGARTDSLPVTSSCQQDLINSNHQDGGGDLRSPDGAHASHVPLHAVSAAMLAIGSPCRRRRRRRHRCPGSRGCERSWRPRHRRARGPCGCPPIRPKAARGSRCH